MRLSNQLLAISSLLQLSLADTVTLTAAPNIPSDEPSYDTFDTFTSAILNSTNHYRSEHNADDLSWNETLAEFAAEYLDEEVGSSCDFEHSGGPYGENLAMGYPDVEKSVEAWGEERDDYDFGDGGFAKKTGHFTQLVWKNTTDVGCGRRLCGEKGWYVVCEYWPVGNVEGEFEDQVEAGSGVVGADVWRVGLVVGVLVFEWL